MLHIVTLIEKGLHVTKDQGLTTLLMNRLLVALVVETLVWMHFHIQKKNTMSHVLRGMRYNSFKLSYSILCLHEGHLV